MTRAAFLHQLGLLAGAFTHWPVFSQPHGSKRRMPLPLVPGDTIGLTSPSGAITTEEILPAVQILQSWGYKVLLGDALGRRDGILGGTDAERAADLQRMVGNPSVRAILCARGGYGITRILDMVDFSPLKNDPKWIIGFSDITALHLHVWRQAKLASIHAKMCNSFPSDWDQADPLVKETILSIRHALTGQPLAISVPPAEMDQQGVAEGRLVGGNLSVIHTCMGTSSEIDTKNAILFLEDVGEYPYSIDRMMTNLKRAGKFANLRGLIIGGFTRMKEESPEEAFGRSIEQMVLEKLGDQRLPVCFRFPVGHQRDHYALVCGQTYRLEVSELGSVLQAV